MSYCGCMKKDCLICYPTLITGRGGGKTFTEQRTLMKRTSARAERRQSGISARQQRKQKSLKKRANRVWLRLVREGKASIKVVDGQQCYSMNY